MFVRSIPHTYMHDSPFLHTLSAGQSLFRQGDSASCAYIIESGRIEISRSIGDASEILAILGPGDIVGEMALIEDLPRSANGTAIEPTTLRVLTRDYLQERVQQADPLLRHLLRRMSRRLRGNAPGPVHDRDHSQAVSQLQIAHDVQAGLERGEFSIHLQPVVRLGSDVVVGYEGLIRWTRPGYGAVPPSDFIPLAEQSNLILDIGRWTFQESCAHLQKLDRCGTASRDLFVAINLSARQFTDPGLFHTIDKCLREYGTDPRRIKLEVTEGILIQNFDRALSVLQRCREMGFQLALDDFGTGYSSLSYLSRLPVHMLKIDRAFVKDVATSSTARKVVQSVAGLGNALGLTVLAEGIENREDADELALLGVELGQGYLYGKAQPLDHALHQLDIEFAAA